MADFSFSKILTDVTKFPTGVHNIRQELQDLFDEIKTYINGTINPQLLISSGFTASANANQAIPATTPTKLNFAVEGYDYGTEYDTATSTFTAKKDGLYRVSGSVGWGSPASGGRTMVEIYKNGAAFKRISDQKETFANTGGTEILLSSGDTVNLYAYSSTIQNTDGSTNAVANYFTVTKSS